MFWKKKKEANLLAKAAKSSSTTSSIGFIICGLGNPGSKYENTRHNCGFMVVDDLAKKHGIAVKKLKFKSLTGEISINGVKVLLMKPSTYMNKSGEAVLEAMQFYKLPPEKVLVLCDDINFDVGVIRIKEKGSDGGQKGLKNIIMLSGSDAFLRLRIGVGKKPHPEMPLSSWVLSPFTKYEAEALEFALKNSVEAAEMLATGESILAMNKFNGVKFDN
ncbi:MAG: aminoacyl-tRNA hydrolase [Oscillospiraceae bacterium]|nr:aminoacyl-tRNA hydrolase [Oscillospiraceae bacterium]